MALRWTLRGRMSLSPRLHTLITIAWTPAVVPLTMKKAWAAPKARAASSPACLITETGWLRLSSGFIEFTSTDMHRFPRNSVSSGLPLPCLCPGTSKDTMRCDLYLSRASYIGALVCESFKKPQPFNRYSCR